MTRKLTVHRKGYHRKAYVRKSGAKVKAAYVPPTTYKIEDIGAPGRGKKVFKVRKGLLKKVGYSTHLPDEERHRALRKADKLYGSVRLWRMLNAQLVYRKRIPDGVKSTFQEDRDWVMKNLISRKEARTMTAPAVRKWKAMTPAARARAMPERKLKSLF